MSIWHAYRRRDGALGVSYANAAGNEQLGVVRGDTPEVMLILWCIDVGSASVGDVIILPSRFLTVLRGESDEALPTHQ